MAEGGGSKQAVIFRPAMIVTVVMYIVVVVVLGVTLRLNHYASTERS